MKQIITSNMFVACSRCGLRFQIINLDHLLRCTRCRPATG